MDTRREKTELRTVDVAVLAKAPLAGQAKTRLAALLGPHGAARAHRQMVLRALCTVRQAGMVPQLWCTPSADHRFFSALRRTQALACWTQVQGDIGARMHAAFAEQALRSARPMLLIGTDCPVLDANHLREVARRLLAGDEAVFTPAEDGGYVLVGLRRPTPALFERIDWGGEQVMSQTLNRLTQLGLRHSQMPTLWDVDRPADWLRWQTLQSACGQRDQPNRA